MEQKSVFSSPNNVTVVNNNVSNEIPTDNILRMLMRNKTILFDNLPFRNVSENLTLIINEHNKKIMLLDKINRKKINRRRSKMSDLISMNSTLINKVRKTTFDAYGSSLQHTNRIFNIKYGFTPRQVPAHAPILIDRDIIRQLQNSFTKEFERTSRNRFRSSDDMQFSFSYYYYLMHERTDKSVAEIFDTFDTDGSGWVFEFFKLQCKHVSMIVLERGLIEKYARFLLSYTICR